MDYIWYSMVSVNKLEKGPNTQPKLYFAVVSIFYVSLFALSFRGGRFYILRRQRNTFSLKRTPFLRAFLFCWWLVSIAINHIRMDSNIFQFSWFKLLKVSENRFDACGNQACMCVWMWHMYGLCMILYVCSAYLYHSSCVHVTFAFLY